MSETTAPRPEPPAAVDEDSGRLVNASRGRLIAILVTLVLFSELVPFQYTMVGIIIPKIGAAFPASGSSTSWALTIIGVVGAATVALAGKSADLFGKKKTLLAISVFFLVGTVICAVTSSWAVFLLGRGLQALSLGVPAVVYGVIRDLMPRRWIPVSAAVAGTGFGVSALAAPLIGGALADSYSWRSIFWFLLIYTAVTIPLLFLIVPESPFRARQRFDWLGAVLFGAGLAATLIYLSEGASWGWGDIGCLAYLIGGLAALVAFVAWENHTTDPMLELSLLRAPRVSIVMALGVFGTLLLSLPNFIIPYMFETPKASVLEQQIIAQTAAQEHYPAAIVARFVHFQGDLGYAAGFSVFQLAWHIVIFSSIAAMIFAPLGGVLARRVGARLPMIIGSVALLAAFALWWQFHVTWREQASIGVLWGLGFGFYYASSPNLLMDAVPAERQGISAGMLAAFGGLGSALATALITPILSSHPFELVATPPGGRPIVHDIPQVYTNAAYTQSYLLIGVIAAVVTVALAIALRSGRSPARGGEAAPAPVLAGADAVVEA
jgi:MFS family permease